jgi:hypothetical protein
MVNNTDQNNNFDDGGDESTAYFAQALNFS